MTTVMNRGNIITSALYPNYYAILQALYSNEYEKHGDYNKAVEIVNEKIAKYTRGFYKYYAGILKERYHMSSSLEEGELQKEMTWSGEYENTKDYVYSLKLNDDNTCELTIKDKAGNILEQASGETMFVDGMLFIRRLEISNASNYTKAYDSDLSLRLMLFVYKTPQSGQIMIRDASFLQMNIKDLEQVKQNSR